MCSKRGPLTRQRCKALRPAVQTTHAVRAPQVGHAFMNETEEAVARKEALGQTDSKGGAIHDPEAIELAWSRVEKFFQAHLY